MKKVGTKKVLKKTGKSKDMRVSELAGMVVRGFTETRTDFEGRFEGVEGRLTILDHKVDRIQDSVNELSYESRKTRTRLENLEFKVFGSIQEP
mgnify:FL=1